MHVNWIAAGLGWWMGWCHRNPARVMVLVAVLLLGALAALTRLGVDTDSSRMIAPHLPAQQRAHALGNAFPTLKQTILVVVRAERADEADGAVRLLDTALRASPDIATVYAPAVDPFFAAHGFLYDDPDAVGARLSRLSQSANLLAQLRSDPSLGGFLAALEEARTLTDGAGMAPGALDRLYAEFAAVLAGARTGTPRDLAWSALIEDEAPVTRVISVIAHPDPTRTSPAKPAVNAIHAAIAALPAPVRAQVDIGVTGEPALRIEELGSVTATIGLSLGLSLVLVVLVLWRGLRSAAGLTVALAALLVTLVLTAGFAALAVGALNLISVAFIVLMVGLGIDFAIHVALHLAEQRAQGVSEAGAVRATAGRVGLALGLSAVTTAGAFLTFTVTDFTGMAQLGLIGGVGVLIAFWVSVTLIPALPGLWPRIDASPPGATPVKRRWPAFCVVLATLAALPFALEARFDADPMNLRDPDSGAVRAFRALAADPDRSPYRVSVLVPDDAAAATVKTRLSAEPVVHRVTTLADLVPGDQVAKLDLLDLAAPSLEHALDGQPAVLTGADSGTVENRLTRLARIAPPALAAEIETYLTRRTAETDRAVTGRLFAHLPPVFVRIEAMLGAGEVTRDDLPAPLLARYLAPDGRQRVDVTGTRDLDAFAGRVREIVPEAAGGPVQLAAAADTVGRAMLLATGLAALLTLMLAWLATRRLGDVAAILTPLCAAGILTAAFSTVTGIAFNYANVIVLPLLIGIGVDSGIHLALRARGAADVFATTTPRAVAVSALTTLAAFATLALSDHRGTASMGILLSVAMLATMVCVFSLTPVIVRSTQAREP